jgi:hypothetical protein
MKNDEITSRNLSFMSFRCIDEINFKILRHFRTKRCDFRTKRCGFRTILVLSDTFVDFNTILKFQDNCVQSLIRFNFIGFNHF